MGKLEITVSLHATVSVFYVKQNTIHFTMIIYDTKVGFIFSILTWQQELLIINILLERTT